MKGTFKIATAFNIPVYLHWSFPLIFVMVLFLGYQIEADLEGFMTLSIYLVSIFFCVVLHEYGHALTARRYGVNTRDIILSPIGGVARLERIPTKPVEELWVALAGPAVNLVIALILFILLLAFRENGLFIYEGESELALLTKSENLGLALFTTNIVLAIFNMAPAFPMDGGRVLRSLLNMKMSRVKATRIAYIVAQVCASLFFIIGLLLVHVVLCFIAVFVVLTSRMEWKSVQRADAINGKSIRDLMSPIRTRLYQDQTINDAIAAISENEKYFLIFNRNDSVVGVLFHEFINHARAVQDLESPIEKYKSNTWQALPSNYPLDKAIALFQQRGYGIVPIMEGNILKGQLDIIKLNQFVRAI